MPRNAATRGPFGTASRVLVALVALAAMAAPAAAATLTVGREHPTLPAALAAAQPGDVVALGGRAHVGAIRIDKAITLVGPGSIDGEGKGHSVELLAAGAVLRDLKVRRSGSDLGRSDACVYVGKAAKGAVVSGVHLEGCCFGVYVSETHDAVVEHNTVVGSEKGLRSLRGNGVHLFNAHGAKVVGNVITGGRDGVYVAATEHSLIAHNRTTGTRFGVHYMFSLHNRLEGNVARNNVTGFAIMQSGSITVVGNVAERNSDHGILFRDVTESRIAGNRAERNGEGLFFYASVGNDIVDNVVRHNGVGAKIWAGTKDNRVVGNVFVGNRRQIFYVASADLLLGDGQRGNYFGDYLGWDQNNDGVGDRPYRVDSFTAHLLYQYPQATLLVRSPALELLAMIAEKMPLWQRPTVIDPRPLALEPVAIASAGAKAGIRFAPPRSQP